MPHDSYKALYLHIPFCVQRCNYCDFATCAREQNSPVIQEYIEDLNAQIRRAAMSDELGSIETIYIGGGTPTHIGSRNLTSLLYTISTSINLENVKEFTMEANPESLTESIVKDAYALGVNRLSMGVQSFDNDVLKILGRVHDADKAREAIKIARTRFENVSIDLMCGIPGQSLDSFMDDVVEAVDFDVQHVSIYPLSIEPHTILQQKVMSKEIPDVDDDVQATHMEAAKKILEAAEYKHYEVASYAQPGFESKHNLSYWQGKPYMGLGESATTMTQNLLRRMRVTDNQVEDDLNPKEMLAEDMMLAMRTCYGVSLDKVNSAKETFGDDRAIDVFSKLEEFGLVEKTDTAYVPTHKGWMLGNDLYSKLMDLGDY